MSQQHAALPPESLAATLLARLAEVGVLPTGVADDSRQLRPGDLFLAYPGASADGRRHIADAIARGACAVIWEADAGANPAFAWPSEWTLANFPQARVRQLCGPLAHAVYGRPSERLSLVAVTGTNGKTSVTHWISASHPRRCAVIGTLGAGLPGELVETGFTTPEATTLMRCLAGFVEREIDACALEASSIGIAEGRLDGARIDVAVFTNLSRDHLDYHASMLGYAQEKARLFAWPRLRLAICNLDDFLGRELAASTTASKVVGYTQYATTDSRPGTIRAENVEETVDGLRFRLCAPQGRAMVESGLLGRFNVSNLLAVAAVLFDAGLSASEVAERLTGLVAPAGRMEKLGGNNEPLIVVDYAHTPDALANALQALRPVAQARGAGLVVVFGCGGDRDRGKRPLMGEVAVREADRVVLTSDNPRSEDEQAIIDEIRAAAPSAEVIADRRQAIRRTILGAHPADVVLLAGKGDEPYQETAGVRRPFSDRQEAWAALGARREMAQ